VRQRSEGSLFALGQLGQKFPETSSSPVAGCGDLYFVILVMQGGTDRRIMVQASLGIKHNPVSKITNAKRADGRTQVVKCLSSKCEALSPTPSTTALFPP
jgi:hypothetical protein